MKCIAGNAWPQEGPEAENGNPRVEKGGGVFRGIGGYLCGCLVNANTGLGKQNQALGK